VTAGSTLISGSGQISSQNVEVQFPARLNPMGRLDPAKCAAADPKQATEDSKSRQPIDMAIYRGFSLHFV
jgi:hypothetical protein